MAKDRGLLEGESSIIEDLAYFQQRLGRLDLAIS